MELIHYPHNLQTSSLLHAITIKLIGFFRVHFVCNCISQNEAESTERRGKMILTLSMKMKKSKVQMAAEIGLKLNWKERKKKSEAL